MTTAIDHPHALHHVSDSELTQELAHAHRSFSTAHATLLSFIAEFHLRDLALRHGARNTAHYLSRELGMAVKTAQEYVTVACRLLDFDMVSAAFHAGDIGYSKVRILVRFFTEENEEELLKLAIELTCTELTQALAGHGRPDGEEQPEDHFSVRVREDGWVEVSGLLRPDDGASLLAAIKLGEVAFYQDVAGMSEEEVDEEFDKIMDANGYFLSHFGTPPAKMMLSSLRGMLNIVRSNPTSTTRAPAAQVNVVVSSDGHAVLPYQPGAQSSEVAALVNNAAMRLLMTDEKGVIVHYGRSRRLVSDALAKAILATQNHTCIIPGCDHQRYMEFHHIVPFEEGGKTDAENLLGLCSSCHMMVTHGIIKIIQRGEDLHFIFPNDVVFTSHRRGLPVRNYDRVDPSIFELNWARNFGEAGTFDDSLFDDPLLTFSFED